MHDMNTVKGGRKANSLCCAPLINVTTIVEDPVAPSLESKLKFSTTVVTNNSHARTHALGQMDGPWPLS